MRKVWIRLLCLALCLAVLLPFACAAGETTRVAAYLLRLREKPSIKAKVLDAYPRGTVVTILKKGDTWTRVRVHEKTGYMQTSLLAYGRKGGGGSGGSSSGTTMYVMAGVRLNLRAEADTNSDILASYRGGTKVTVLRKGRYWSYVEVGGLKGYMGNDYLTDTKGN